MSYPADYGDTEFEDDFDDDDDEFEVAPRAAMCATAAARLRDSS